MNQNEKIEHLKRMFVVLNSTLEAILYIQFEIEHSETGWINAIQKLEDGYGDGIIWLNKQE